MRNQQSFIGLSNEYILSSSAPNLHLVLDSSSLQATKKVFQ